jgi:hypothetical protein
MSLRIVFGILLFATQALAQEPIDNKKLFTEEKAIQLFRAQSVSLQQAKAQFSEQQLNSSLNNEPYQARVFSTYNFKKSNETALNQFQPILTPYEDWSLGVEKKLPVGMKLSLSTFGTQYSFQDNTVRDATQVGGKVAAEIDLWKNIFGRLDRAQLTSARVQKERSEIQHQVNLKSQEAEFRKMYWNFVTVSQSIELSKSLVKSAEKQLLDVKKRKNEGISDSGEVARNQSQLESRNSSLLLFDYEKEITLQFFENQSKDFRSSDWKFDFQSAQAKEMVIGQCIAEISNQKELNLNYTSYDEMVELLQTEVDAEVKIAQKHGDLDLSLVGEYQTTGVASEYDDARDNLETEKKGGHYVGLQLSIPLGSTRSESEKHLVSARKNSIDSQKSLMMNQLRSTHDTIIKSIRLLNQGLSRQLENTKNLEISYREMNKKFRQGRVSVSELVNEQDALFQSELRELELKKQIAHIMLDYFSVFNKFPCAWNNI